MSNGSFIDLSFVPPASALMIELGQLEEEHPIAINWASINEANLAHLLEKNAASEKTIKAAIDNTEARRRVAH